MPRPGGGFGNPKALCERQSQMRERPSLAALYKTWVGDLEVTVSTTPVWGGLTASDLRPFEPVVRLDWHNDG